MSYAYRLPRAVVDRLETALEGRKNAPAALALAEWLARFWSAPRRLLYAFPVDRRAVAGREDLGLTEARVRGALAVLEEIGFLARYEPDPGKRYQRTEEGLHRRPILFRFGEEYGVAFARANARAQAARGAPAPARRSGALPTSPGPSMRLSAHSRAMPAAQLAQKQNPGGSLLIMGEVSRPVPDSPLEAALEKLRRGVGA
ncbi:hypothetical protein OPKNFCMD_6675 [Methylobacterium crusticola]|uniref:Helix-turn-helix domain-containing protein n=1 Tax=Methylobacterium crusticola TaxID=1697972 RepID=A0ABQ4R849_9HYPH|nr:hypothetical protein [Methylobacterium crusticola]GJD53896.1 hypothetical protein OPKNFCMD_6675 [Methylobacterium crusticola]